jgi:hypothetical protein
MGEDLERVQGRVSAEAEHAGAQQRPPGAGHHPALTTELSLQRGRHPLARARLRLIRRPPAALGELEGKRYVLTAAGRQEDVGVAANRVDGAIPRGDPREPGLERADPHLIAPVEALLVFPARPRQAKLAADVADPRLGQGRYQPHQRLRLPDGVGIGEGEHLTRGVLDGGVQGVDLAPAVQLEHDVCPTIAGALGGGVGATVAGDDDLESLTGIVEREGHLHPAADHRLLGMGGDDQGNTRRLRCDRPGPIGSFPAGPERPHQAPQCERVTEMGVDEQTRRDPKCGLEYEHRGVYSRGDGRSAAASAR